MELETEATGGARLALPAPPLHSSEQTRACSTLKQNVSRKNDKTAKVHEGKRLLEETR
ncbi:hypothetical protein P7K49_027379, partial [Saguinus oedipus]